MPFILGWKTLVIIYFTNMVNSLINNEETELVIYKTMQTHGNS